MKKEKVLVIPGTYWQVALIKRLKEKGHDVLVIHPYEDSPAFYYADHHLLADILDVQSGIDFCRKSGITAILSDECDIAMPVVAKLIHELRLLGLSVEAASQFTDKLKMRELCQACEIPNPEYEICRSMEDALRVVREVKTRMILKPLDSNSSRGVFVVNGEDDIKRYFDMTISFSKVRKEVLLERYIEGKEYTVDGIKTPKKHYSIAISEKKHYKYNSNVASELLFFHHNEKVCYEELRTLNDRLIESSSLQFGLTHVEYKYENGKFYLIEMAARGGGNMISSHIVPFMSGIDNYGYLIDCSLGKVIDKDFSVLECYEKRCAVLKFFNVEGEGMITDISGVEYLKAEPQIVEYGFNYGVGDWISLVSNDSLRSGFYIACCEHESELISIMENVERKINITVSK